MQVSATTYDATSGQYLGGTLTLGADFTVTQTAGASSYLQGDYIGATIVNEGTIDADGAYTQFTPTDFVNAGTITVGGTDTLETYGTFINTGSISIDAGGVLKISGLATLSGLGSISNAGTLDINGTLDGGGGTIDIAPTTGFATVELQGTIENATIEGAGGNFIIAGGTLENDQITGDLVVSDTYNSLAVEGGLLGGGTLDMSATNDSIYVVQAETFGDATLLLGNGGALIESGYTYDATTSQNVGVTLTLGPDFVLGQGAGASSYLDGYYTGAAIVNEGTIDADGTYTQVSPTNFVNTGAITVGGTDTLQIYGSFANTGAITIDAGGTLEISGTTDLASLASIHSSGVLYIDNGTLVGGGGTIDIAPTTAFATLELSGTIENATLLGADGSFVIANGTLDGDQIAGDVTAANNYAGLAVLGGLSGGGTLDLSATNDTIYADETETFDDTTLILGSGSELDVAAYTYDATSQQDLGGTLTLGPDFVVTQGAGDNSYLEGSYTGAAIVNEGTIDAVGNYTQLSPTDFVNAGTIVVGGTDTLRVYGTFSNTGIIESVAGTGALVQFESADGLQGGTLTGGTYAALDGSDLTLALGGLPTTLTATVELDGNGAAIGIVDPSNNATDDLGAVLTTIGAGGRLVLSNGATLATDGLTVAAGGTIFGTGTITGALVDNGLVEANGGTLAVDLSGSGTLAIDPGASLAIAGAATGVTVAFNGVGTLDLSDPAGFAGTIANLGTDSVLSLTGVSITSGTIEADRLVLSESGGGSLTYALASPSPALTNVTLVPTSSGDTILFKSNTEDFASDEIVQLSGSGTLARSGNDVTVDLGNVRQNATSPGVELGVANTQPSGADTLAGSFTTAVASPYAASGFAAFTNVAGGSTIDAGSIGLATSGAGGIVSAHVTLAGTSEGATTTPLAADVATVTGTLYDEADPTLASSTIAVAARVAAGGTLVGSTELSNGPASVPYTENLDYQVNSVASPFSLDAAVASSGTLASGNGTPLSFDIGTGSAGAFSTTIGLGLATDGNGVDGLGTLALPSQSVSLTADIFGTAQVGGFGTITLPDIVHTGDPVTAYATITNPSFYTLQDDLTGSLGSVSGLSADSGSFDAPAGSSSVLGFALDTGTTGSNVATAAYDLASTDTPLGSETLSAPGTLAFDYTVQNYATAALSEASGGAGTLTPTGIANNYVLDFGTIVSGSPDVTGTINVGNAAMGVADWLDGTLVSSGSTFDFTNDTNSVSHLLAGQSPDILGAITFDPTTDGNYAETLVLQPYSGNADGDTARPDVYLTVEAKVVAQSSGGSMGVSTHGHTTAGYTTHGHTTTGYTTTGYTTTGYTTSGHTTSGHTTSGHTTSGHTTSGHTTSGHTTSGHSSSGHSSSGHSSGGHSSSGHSSGGHSSGGESTGGHSSGGHSSGGHSSGGQSSGGQSSGGHSSGSPSSGGQSSGGGYTTGGGEGDTHLLTFNGSRYDFQAAGEFVLVKNKDIQVQIRLEPAGGAADPTGSVSYITQTAIGVGRERITIDFTRATALYVNGAPVSLMAGQFLKLPGVTIYDEGNDYLVKAATGEKVMVGNEVTTVALNGAGGSPVGLLGSWTESKADTFTLPDGKVLSSPLSFADLYQTFANAWRVTTATSLFDYPTDPTTGDPENTNSPQITNLDFPATPVTVSDLPASVVQQAQQVVTGLGITDPSQQQNAILDYVLSGGNLAVVSSDLSAQQQGQTGGAPAAITNPPPPVYAGIIPPEGSVTVNGTAELAAFQVYRTGDTSTALTLNYAVEAPGNSNYVTSAEYGGVLASGTITIAAGQTAATLDIATPGTLVLPSEELLVGISTSASDVDLVSTSAQAALVTTLPVRGIDAVPDFYATSALGVVSTAGSITTYSIGTIGADGIGTIDAGLGNETPNYGNALGGTLAVRSGDGFDIIGLGTIDLAPGGSDNIGVDPGVTTLGTHTETLELSPTSFNSSGYTGTLAPEYFVVTDTVVDPTAMPSALPATETLIGRVNENFSTAVTIANNAVIGSDDLDVTLTDTGGDVVVGSSSPLAPGASTALALNEAPGLAAGTFSDTLDVGYVSHDPNSGGHADVTLPGTTVTLDGTVYAQAVASLGTKVIDFGTVHEGAADPLMSLTVTNTASGTLADDLIATTAKAGGIFTATGSLDLAAGAAGTLEYGLNTAVGGSFTSTALVTVSSHDDAQADLALGTRAVRLEGTVISDAAPGYVEVSGPGAIVALNPTLETLNLGTLVEGTAAALSIAIANTATGLADTLSGTLEFVSSGSTIDLGTISGISAGSTSDAFGFTFDAATMGADTGTLVFDGESIGSAGTVALAPDLLDITATVVCFCPGTRIATPDGERAVEELAAGDLVLTAAGIARPVRWLGRQTVATRFADPFRVAPIRIRAGALGDNVPVRDLLVSPDHALMVDSVFVQAGALVNGVSITREDADMPERLIYFHVELADHALILAEGVEAETFIDNVDRLAFDNWDEHQALSDDTAPMREMTHSRAKAHRQVPKALRAWLVARGVALYGRDVAGVA